MIRHRSKIAMQAGNPMGICIVERLAVVVGEGKGLQRHEAICSFCGKRPKKEAELAERWMIFPRDRGRGIAFICPPCWQRVSDYALTETTELAEYDREHPYVKEDYGNDNG